MLSAGNDVNTAAAAAASSSGDLYHHGRSAEGGGSSSMMHHHHQHHSNHHHHRVECSDRTASTVPPYCSNATSTSSTTATTIHNVSSTSQQQQQQQHPPMPNAADLTHCSDPQACVTLAKHIDSLKLSVSVDQAWALIHQSVLLYRTTLQQQQQQQQPETTTTAYSLIVPKATDALCLHRDGSVHIAGADATIVAQADSEQRILNHLGYVVYTALNGGGTVAGGGTGCTELTGELERVLDLMTLEEEAAVQGADGQQSLEAVLALCTQRLEGEDGAADSCQRGHYKAVCRALVTESLDLRDFLHKVCKNGDIRNPTTNDPSSSSASASPTSLMPTFGFIEWTRFWVQVVEELRQGVRLKKHNAKRPSQVFEMTPYEILMADIRTRNYELRKVMVDGELPSDGRVVKHDAHDIILEFIRSRPPLRSAADRKLAPLRVQPTPREQLLQEIRGTPQLRVVPRAAAAEPVPQQQQQQRRVITVDLSLFDDDEEDDNDATMVGTAEPPPPPQANNSNAVAAAADGASAEVQRRNGTISNAHRTSKRRHTIVGCQSNVNADDELSDDGDSLPSPFLKEGSEPAAAAVTINPLNPLNTITQQALAEWTAMTLTDDENDDDDDGDDAMHGVAHNGDQHHHAANGHGSVDSDPDVDIPHATPAELPEHTSDRLTLSLEEIVHIRSVMTKAELEGLPVDVQIKEDVERRKICFLCLRTRFSLFRQWGVQCKLCQRTVCTKCHTKMRIPTEHFRNVPVMLLSASLMGSPVTAVAPHETTIVERSSARLVGRQHTAGSAPATPRMYRNGGTGAPANYLLHHHHHHQQLQQHRGSTASASAAAVATVAAATSSATAAIAAEATVRGAAQRLARHHTNDVSLMSRSMDADALMTGSCCSSNNGGTGTSSSMGGRRNLPPQSPRSHPNTLDRQQSRFGFLRSPTPTTSNHAESCHRDVLRGELSSVCNDCRDLVNNICRSSKQTRSSARNKTLRSLHLDLSPVYRP